MTDRELMQQALDALESECDATKFGAAEDLRARLAQPDLITHADVEQLARIEKLVEDVDPYTAPPQRGFIGLTDEDIRKLSDDCAGVRDETEFIRAIEAKLKEKNT